MNYKRDIAVQLISSCFFAILLTIIFVSYDYSEQGKTYIGFRINNSIIFIFYFIGASLISIITGLFIRLNNELREWSRKKYWISFLIILIGISLSLLSIEDENIILREYRMDGMDFEYWYPKPSLQVSGWFLTIFGAQHLFLPKRK